MLTFNVPRFPPGLCAFLYGLQLIVGESAAGMYLPPEPPSDLEDAPLPADHRESPTVPNAPGMPTEGSFEEALGPTELFYQSVPNEGDVQLVDAVNRAIYLSIYQGTEQERLERWESMWQRYEAKESGVSHSDSLPPSHMCSAPTDFPSPGEAVGSFKESVLDQEELLYLSDFSMPPFIYLSHSPPRGQIRVEDVRFSPGRGVESHGVLRDLVEEIIAPMLTKKYNVSGLAANWSFRYPSCDFRTAADSLYSNRGSMYVGLATPTPYMSKYFKASCPVMMYGMMSLISGYLRGPREGGVASWNKPDITIGTVAFLPYGKLVADHLPKVRPRKRRA
uniref:Uncharacterized protein n=1 Tax=Neospora caninum (strain Liverpool) TaxID=572307 RepID=A0A0F7U5N5_NEOCL|nr:TPA: hypothetical protein BN1204_009570 [Neospora caninum Liverpool]